MGTKMEQGWPIVESEISKLISILEGVPDPESPPNCGKIYSTVYDMCQEKHGEHICEKLYGRYQDVYNNYLSSKVLPSIREKKPDDASMLQELVKRWENHKVMVTKLSRGFNYLDRYYIRRRKLPSLEDVGFGCFREIVYVAMKEEFQAAVLALVKRGTDDMKTILLLLKGVLLFFVEIEKENQFLTEFTECYNEKGLDGMILQRLLMELDMAHRHRWCSSTEEKVVLPEQGQTRLRELFYRENNRTYTSMIRDISGLQRMH